MTARPTASIPRLSVIALGALLLPALPAPGAYAQAIRRDDRAGTPFASSVLVPAGADTLYLSGVPSNVAGGTQAQTADVLAKLGAALKVQGFDYADVVNAKVYLVADPATGRMDFAGMNAAFVKVFGAPGQPNRPSRVTVQVAGLAMPGALVEIELTAAKVRK